MLKNGDLIVNILIIGNGFDLAHGLPTTYNDFLLSVKGYRENYNEENLQAVSYDICASNVIQVFNRIQGTVDLRSKESIKLSNKEVFIDYGYKIMPGEYILVKTKEKFNMTADLTGHIRPRTTFTRLGLVLSDQHINPTFSGHLYLGFLNTTPNAIEIFPELIIGQIVFEKISGDITENLLYKNKKDAKYQNENTFVSPDISKEINSNTIERYKELMKDLAGE